MFYLWLLLVIILSIVEIITVNLVSIWFVISGIVAMIASLFTDNLVIQISIFVILGLIFMLLTRKIVKKIVPEKVKTNLDRIIGMQGIVITKIGKNKPGEVKVDGKIWTATSDETINQDEIVKILEINSTKLKVEKIKE
ncbi:MAG: NfeD family protein [Bacilli bacterium]